MPDLAKTIKDEINRIARREIRKSETALKTQIVTLKKVVSEQKRTLSKMEKAISKWIKDKQERVKAAKTPTPEEVERARLSSESIAKLRERLSLSRNEMAALMDVDPNSIFHWENGKTTPRAASKAKLVELRNLGKREISKRLKELMPEKKSRRRRSRKAAATNAATADATAKPAAKPKKTTAKTAAKSSGAKRGRPRKAAAANKAPAAATPEPMTIKSDSADIK